MEVRSQWPVVEYLGIYSHHCWDLQPSGKALPPSFQTVLTIQLLLANSSNILCRFFISSKVYLPKLNSDTAFLTPTNHLLALVRKRNLFGCSSSDQA